MDSDIELWKIPRKKVVDEEDLDPADFERLLLENRDSYGASEGMANTASEEGEMSSSTQEDESPFIQSPLSEEKFSKADISRQTSIEVLTERPETQLIIGILWDGSDSASLELIFHVLPKSKQLNYLVQQVVSDRYLALEVDEIRRYTKIPVIEAMDGLAVLPGRIYLGPFGQQLSMVDGYIRLRPVTFKKDQADKGLEFFSSIASQTGASPVGIIFDEANEKHSALIEDRAASLVNVLSRPDNKDLMYAEVVNTLVNTEGHVFFHRPDLLQSEILVSNEYGHAMALKAPAAEISVALQRLILGEALDDEPLVTLALSSKKADIPEGEDIEIYIQPGWEAETLVETQESKQAESDEQWGYESESTLLEQEKGPEDTEKLPSGTPTELAVIKAEFEKLQRENNQLREENAELIEICQLMDMESEARGAEVFFASEPVNVSQISLVLLDKNMNLRAFNRSASESMLAIDIMDIGKPLEKILASKKVEIREIQKLDATIREKLGLGHSRYGESGAVDFTYERQHFLFNILPMQSQAGQLIGLALSWINHP